MKKHQRKGVAENRMKYRDKGEKRVGESIGKMGGVKVKPKFRGKAWKKNIREMQDRKRAKIWSKNGGKYIEKQVQKQRKKQEKYSWKSGDSQAEF